MKVPTTVRAYVIGDVHGCADLLTQMLKNIEKDAQLHPQSRHILVTLGDYIDRGPHSRKVIETLIHLPLNGFETRYLKGNHEDMFLNFLRDPEEGLLWLSNGGWATLVSYGFKVDDLPRETSDLPLARDRTLQLLPPEHLTFFKSLKLHYQLGDYFFVHAGVCPGIPLDKQTEEDLLWIRSEFLHSKTDFGKIVVHGHTIVKEPEIHNNRIALDTGAFHTGNLSCLVLSGGERYFL
ncbi:metallophosphoesterase family protein [Coxiella burnetii]|uniref:metallophosphoesterase family protein n=1 Tax=Coxiella burnetii TaxID=777 RepID=UPI002231D5A6|nr:metallophosphoesterase family protein [Coxiella burnetii]